MIIPFSLMGKVQKTKLFLIFCLLVISSTVVEAAPTVVGKVISWPSDGWYEVQDSELGILLCEGTSFCEVEGGVYTVINHTTDTRYENIVVEDSIVQYVQPKDWSAWQGPNSNFGVWVSATKIVATEVLRVSVLASHHLGVSASFQFPEKTQEVWLEHCVRFDENWSVSEGGKLPGFAGDSSPWNGGQGGNPSNGTNAWSARMLFGTDENSNASVPLGSYIYHTNQAARSDFGDVDWWSPAPERLFEDSVRIPKNEWRSVQQHIKINSSGKNNGVLEARVDGELVYFRDNLNFTNNDIYREINRFWLNVYVGGSVPAESDQTVYFAKFRYSYEAFESLNECSGMNVGSNFRAY